MEKFSWSAHVHTMLTKLHVVNNSIDAMLWLLRMKETENNYGHKCWKFLL